MNPKFCSMLGLAMRAGRIACGEGKAADAVRGGSAHLLLLAVDASENTQKRFSNMTHFYEVPLLRAGFKKELGAAIGKSASAVLAITDVGFAEQLMRLSGKND